MVLALPALAPIVIALAVMLLLWALSIMLVKPLMVVLGGLPFVGQQAANAVGSLAAALSDFVAALVARELQAATNVVDFITGNATLAVRWATAAATWLGITLRAALGQLAAQAVVLTVRVGALAAELGAAARGLAAAVARIAVVAASVARIVAVTIPAAVAQGVLLAITRATALVEAVRSALTAAVATALATALRAVGLETAARAANDLAVRSWAQALIAAQAATAAVNLAHATALVQSEVGQLGRVITDVNARIGPIAAPTVAIAIGTLVTELTTLRRTCVDPTCNYLSPQLQALELAGDLTMLAAVGALIAEAAQNPQRAAADTIATSSPLVGGAAGLLAELTGFHA